MGLTYRKMVVAAALACLVAGAITATPAYAEGPELAEKTLFSDNFDSGTSQLTLAGKGLGYTAYWGPSPTSSYSGDYALWVAGKDAAGNPSSLNRYPDGTMGTATKTVQGFEDMYSGHVSFRYLCQAVGGADAGSTSIHLATPDVDRYWGLGLSPTWDLYSYDTAVDTVISREPLRLQFVFADQVETGGTGTGDPIGPSIDDLVVSGFKYGPVGNLQAVPSGTNVTLTWTKPKKGPLDATDDERPIAYRVYKRIRGGAWTELTSTRADAAPWNDTTGMEAGNIYEYAVQPWDTGAGDGYGRPSFVEVPFDVASDRTSPVISFANLAQGGLYDAGLVPEISVADNVDSGLVPTVTLDSAAYSLGTPITKPGTHQLIASVADRAGNRATASIAFSIKGAVTQQATSLALSVPPTPAYASATVKGNLTASGAVVPGRTVKIEQSANGSSWSAATSVVTDANGGFAWAANPKVKTWYRATFAGDAAYKASPSAVVIAKPKVSLGTPVAPKTMKAKKGYTVYGSLKPKHTKGSKSSVRIYKYKWVSKKWKAYGYVKATNTNYNGYTRYKVKMSLPSKGTWKLEARAVADSLHSATTSAKYDKVKVM